jgi:hypothetical protein
VTTIRPVRVNHMNAVVEDFTAARVHFETLLGAEFLLDLPQAEWHAGLVETGRVIFELFAPPAFVLYARYGAHWLGIEYQADMDEVRASLSAHGIRIARDIGVALHTHPEDTLGVAFEFYGGSFHDDRWPLLGGRTMHPAEYWRDAHPIGLTGLEGTTIVVRDIARAGAFLRGFLDAQPLDADAHRARFRIADSDVELLAPATGELAARQIERYGEGILSTVFGVRDLDQARRHFAERDVPVIPGSAPGRIAIPPDRNLGLLIEFAA